MNISIKKMIRYCYDSNYRFLVKADRGCYDNMPDEEYLKRKFEARVGYKLNLENPKSFNEKLQWLKIYDRKEIYQTMVDKYEVKKYVSNIIGEEYLIPTLGVYGHFDDINVKALPEKFVMKCTHDSGGLVICKDKKSFNIDGAKSKIEKSLGRNYYYVGREWPYKNVIPRIIVEPYLSGLDNQLTDYKIMCFNGQAKCVFVCTDRFTEEGLKITFFDLNWNRLPFERHYPSSSKEIAKPVYLSLMIKLAEELSKDIPFARIDFYEIENKVLFGEITLYPGNGFEEFKPELWDYTLGSWLELPH